MPTGSAKRALLPLGLLWLLALAKSFELEPPYFRPWELLIQGSATHFLPGRVVEMEEFGNLAYRHWVRALRRPRRTVFTTDGWGFRNAERFAEAPPVVVIGDSFVAGAGLSDSETLPARLRALSGRPVYNFGAQFQHGPPLFLADPRFTQFPPALVIWAPCASCLRPVILPEPGPPRAAPGWAARLEARFERAGEPLLNARTALERDNGLGRFAKHLYHETSYALLGLDALIYPDGEPALVESLEAQRLHLDPTARELEPLVQSLLRFQAELARRGSRLLVVPIPGSGDIYADLFPPAARARLSAPAFLDVLLPRLEAEGVRAVDLRPLYRRERSPYLYLRDDTHWTPRTVELTAQALLPLVRTATRSR